MIAGRAGRAWPLACSFSFSNMARGRGRRWRRPGRGRAFLAGLLPRELRAGREGGEGACVRAWVDVTRSWCLALVSAPLGRWRRPEVGGCPLGREWARAQGHEGGRDWPSWGGSLPPPPGSCVALSLAPHPKRVVVRGSQGPRRGWGRRRLPALGVSSEPPRLPGAVGGATCD